MTDDEPDRSESPPESAQSEPEPPETDPATEGAAPTGDGDSTDASGPSERNDAPTDDGDAPLSDLARRVSERRRTSRSGSQPDGDGEETGTDHFETRVADDEPPSDTDSDPFDQMSVGEIDEETLWSSLEGDAESERTVGIAGDAEPASDARSDHVEYVVSKDSYCQSCPYLDDPPELACTHEGTEIVEVVDTDHFRVRNCPMVED